MTLNITVAWGWFIFIINTLMTGGILYKIMLDNLVCVCVRVPDFVILGGPLVPRTVCVAKAY